jgi:hypothetical protein
VVHERYASYSQRIKGYHPEAVATVEVHETRKSPSLVITHTRAPPNDFPSFILCFRLYFILFGSTPKSLQDSSMKYLHYADSALKFDIRNGFEDMKDRIDLSLISEVATGTCAVFPQVVRAADHHHHLQAENPGSPTLPSPLSFSLLTASGTSLADQIAPDQSRWADWVDGLNMLRSGGHVASNETDMFVQALTEIGLKIRLLSEFSF